MPNSLFTEHELNTLYRYSVALCDDQDTAFDILQSAVERCLKKPPEQNSALLSYARTVIRNIYIDQYRHSKKHPHESLNTIDETNQINIESTSITASTDSLENTVIQQDLLERLWPKLDPFEREILVLWAIEGYTTEEIATLLSSKKGTIVSRIHRLRTKLKANQEVTSSEAFL